MKAFFILCFFILVHKGASYANDSMLILETANALSAPSGTKELPKVKPEPADIKPTRFFGTSSDVTYASAYIWHGLDYSDQKPVLQPEVTLSLMKMSAIVWLNYDFQSYKAVNEYDLTLQYTDKLGPAGISVGYTYLTYPNRGWSDSEEVWIQGSYDQVLNPILSIHDDFKSGAGWYYCLGISHPYESPIGNITPAVSLYYHDHYYGESGFPSAEFDLADAVSFGQVTSSAKISYYRALKDGDFRDIGDQFVYSFNLSWSLP